MAENPKIFISYSWSSAEHEKWVINLATQLRENGVEVILDKWDLKEGHDAIKFMEQMVTDPAIKKVVVVLDRVYAEKADGRLGGVGTETQIISAEVYAKADQNKFVGVIAETNADGKPFLPAFYKSRVYIDLSDEDIYAANFEQLLRWAFDKPLHVKPKLGKVPEFLSENTITIATQSRARRAIELVRSGATGAAGALEEYLATLANELEAFRIKPVENKQFDDLVMESVEAFLPYRNEFIEVISTLSRYWSVPDAQRILHKFFERILPYYERGKDVSQWSDWDFDNFRFISHELFLYTIAILLRDERFSAVRELMESGYYLGDAAEDRANPVAGFGTFRRSLRSMQSRNERLKLRRLSLTADMLEKRSHVSGIPFRSLMQADFVLFLRDSIDALKTDRRQNWWPDSLVYVERHSRPFEIFARAQSASYFEKIKSLFDIKDKNELGQVLAKFSRDGRDQNAPLFLPHWEYTTADPQILSGFDKLATRK